MVTSLVELVHDPLEIVHSKHGLNKEVRQFVNSTSKDAFIYFEAEINHVQELLQLGYKIKKNTCKSTSGQSKIERWRDRNSIN